MNYKNTENEYYNTITPISLNTAYGEFYGGSGTTTITVNGTYYKISGTTTVGALMNQFTHANNRLTYNGPTKIFHASVNGTFSAQNNDLVGIGFAKNGSIYNQSVSTGTVGNSTNGTFINSTDFLELTSGDYVEVWTTNITRTVSVVSSSMNMTLFSIN